ncbi:MAG: NAD(P)-dependent alcohol dehydrogenase [Flavobacteriales bacterium]|nr:NAD(P)-dependent alcohol dehydrogenase [Flavobacteriales bacterium]
MKAIISTNYGGPEILQMQEVSIPTPKKNEVLVKIHAASVSKADAMMRTGKPYFGRLFMGLTKPKNPIAGTGFAGVVEALGDDVKLFKIGDKIFGENITTFGTHAEFVCVAEDGVIAKMPSNMTYQEAAPICDGALTSINFLKNLGEIKPGQKVLINGASGSLGTAAVQIAKHYGAEVTGVCSTRNVDFVKSLGADRVIDYTKQDFTENSNTYDIIYDTVGMCSFSECKDALTENGAYISPVLGMPLLRNAIFTSMFGKKKAKFSATGILPVSELKKLLQEVIEIIEAGALRTIVEREYALEETAEAHTYIDKGHKKGSVVITPSLEK